MSKKSKMSSYQRERERESASQMREQRERESEPSRRPQRRVWNSRIIKNHANHTKLSKIMYLSPSTYLVGCGGKNFWTQTIVTPDAIKCAKKFFGADCWHAARFPPLSGRQPCSYRYYHFLCKVLRIRFSRERAADLSADATWKLRLRFSRHNQSAVSLPRNKHAP